MSIRHKPHSVEEYISGFPNDVQQLLNRIRALVKQAAPEAVESISYGMPAYKLNGTPLVYFAGYKNHIGLYATPTGHSAFEKELSVYKQGKGSVQFPLDKPMPFDLIERVVKFRVEEAGKKSTSKTKSSTANKDIQAYNNALADGDKVICNLLCEEISRNLPAAEKKIWHGHPVWFLEGNPVVGYSKLKGSVRLLFWSGQSFDEAGLQPEGSFKAAEARYTEAGQVDKKELKRWLEKAEKIQWDYKNIVKRKGVLERLK